MVGWNMSDAGVSIMEDVNVSDETLLLYRWVVFTVICQMLNIFGIVTNVINIICFVKQGFNDSVNISLAGLSVSDLCSLVTMVWICISYTPAVTEADLPFDTVEVNYLISAMPHFTFTRVSSCITAMITLERCLCITAPLQIKNIVTKNRALVAIISVFVISFCSVAPVYVVNKLGMTFSPVRNKTIVRLVFMQDKEKIEKIAFIINNFTIPFVAFIIIVICTIILTLKLQKATEWREKTIKRQQAGKVSNRNQKAAKMVVLISTLFIICFIPICIAMLAAVIVPALLIQGKYINISIVIYGLGSTLESINSSMNIFIYYNMSSKYRDTFRSIFSISK